MVTLARSQTGHHLEITPTPTRVSLRWMRRLAGGSLLATGAVLGGIYSMDEGLWRSVRVLSSLVPMFADYHWTSFKLRNEADDSEAVLRAFDAYHHKWAREPLNAVLDLRGFYVKVGQMMAGFPGDGLPKPYKEQLLVLQEHVPAQPFEVIRGIVEAELGCPLEDVFSEFPEDPIGAASIGQVHLARLKHDGSRVVVKVQYPEVEKNFRMDFSTIMAIFEQINPEFVEPLEAMEECFKSEFNYSLEAANLRRMCAEVKPHFTRAGSKLDFPEPYDKQHPRLPPALKEAGRSLVTRRVLVMDLCRGKSVSKVGRRLMEDFAASRGQDVAAFEKEMRDKMEDPAFVDEMLRRSVPSAAQLAFYRRFLGARDGVRNTAAFVYNWSLGWVGSRIDYAYTRLPPNGPSLMQELYDVHGYEIFEVGAFNADPHAGNVILDESDDTLSLIDYGQLIEITEEDKKAFAYIVLGIENDDEELIRHGYTLIGNDVSWRGRGRVVDMRPPPPGVAGAFATMHFGGAAGLQKGLRCLGFQSVAESIGPELQEMIDIHRTSAAYMMLQRCCVCLSGVAEMVGAGGISPAKMLVPSALRYLQGHGLPLRPPHLPPKCSSGSAIPGVARAAGCPWK